ncbi:MAG: glycosyltransferase [Sphingomonadales bacterium]|nr:glycosyltransferase [Sphingomonadales bacterium]
MRVLSVSTLFPNPARPAFGKFVANQMAAVAARGDCDLTIVNPLGIPPWPLSRRAPYAALAGCPAMSGLAGLAVHHPRFTVVPVVGGDSNPARLARAVLPLARRLHDERRFDLVDAQFFFPDGPAALAIARALGVPLTVKARGSDIHYWSTRPRALAQLRAAADGAAGMLAVSAALKRDMVALGMPEERIRVHYTGLDHARFRLVPQAEARAEVAAQLGIPAEGSLFVCPGALIAIKGQALAVRAVAELPGARLALAGSGADEAALRALAGVLGIGERVHFLGQVPHERLPVLMAAADAVVLPSEREGLANVWIEALACGAPLVIPDIGGAREVVSDDGAGRIAPRAPDAIAAALRALVAAAPDRRQVAAHAARFSWEANAAQLVGFWREIAGGVD